MSLRVGPPTATLPPMPAAPVFQTALGEAVKTRRQDLGLTQEQVSLHSDLHQRWISNVETGKRNPSYASLRRLAAALELSTSDLIARAEAAEAQLTPRRGRPKAASTR
jgi:transcriptional regulator with XRE-family HTH domain